MGRVAREEVGKEAGSPSPGKDLEFELSFTQRDSFYLTSVPNISGLLC